PVMSSWVSRGKISIPMRRDIGRLLSRWPRRHRSPDRPREIQSFDRALAGIRSPLRLSALQPHQPALLAVPGPLLQRLALVVQLLAAGDRDLDLRPPSLVEIELERHDGHAFALDGAG